MLIQSFLLCTTPAPHALGDAVAPCLHPILEVFHILLGRCDSHTNENKSCL